jgi:hypothetical protein
VEPVILVADIRRDSQISIEVNTAIFAGSITKLFPLFAPGTLLDTPDHFDYDSACTMILNLARLRMIFSEFEVCAFIAPLKTSGADRSEL